METGASYTDVLPAINLSLEVLEDQFVRFAAGKTMARPRMDEMRASITAGVGVDSRRWSGSSGNPELEPWRAKALVSRAVKAKVQTAVASAIRITQ